MAALPRKPHDVSPLQALQPGQYLLMRDQSLDDRRTVLRLLREEKRRLGRPHPDRQTCRRHAKAQLN